MNEHVINVLRMRAAATPDRVAFTFHEEEQESVCTYADLDARARGLAAQLQRSEMLGERVILCFPSGLDYIASFFGVLYAGAVAVPAYPPRRASANDRNLGRILAVIEDAAPRVAMTTPAIYQQIQTLFEDLPQLAAMEWLVVDDSPHLDAEAWTDPQVTLQNLAFLQYTSGSTSAPKGVMVTHGNLVANERLIQQAFNTSPDEVCVGWLPLFHDMGLIGNILQPVYTGFPCHLMAPVSFLQRPARWLELIHEKRATLSGGPNFAYELCARRVTEKVKAQLDLSCWKLAFNGAEPIRPETLEMFADSFAPHGFDAAAFFPCYGLAESTLMVSGGAKQSRPRVLNLIPEELEAHHVVEDMDPDETGRRVVSSGPTFNDHEQVAIVEPQTAKRCTANEVGEIWVHGPSVASGYWQRPEATQAAFDARIVGEDDKSWMRTGDFGFIKDGELYVTGRLKELIIIRGRNHYPQDIEHTVQHAHAALRHDNGAAFTVTVDGEERLVVVQEVERTHLRKLDIKEAISTIRLAVSGNHQLHVHSVVLIKPTGLPKTTSGKIQRAACMERYLNGSLPEVGRHTWTHEVVQREERIRLTSDSLIGLEEDEIRVLLEKYLRSRIAHELNVALSDVPADESISALGLDSLMAIELQHRIQEDLALSYPMEKLLRGPKISEMAATFAHMLAETAADQKPNIRLPRVEILENSSLSYNQRSLWFMHQLEPNGSAYHIPVPLRIISELDVSTLRRAFRILMIRHPMLRMVFELKDGAPHMRLYESWNVPFQVADAGGMDDITLRRMVEAEVDQPFDLTRLPVFRIKLFQRAKDDHLLVLVMHHLSMDMWSMFVLLEELGEIYATMAADKEVLLPEMRYTYVDFVHWQAERLNSQAGTALWSYWQKTLAGPLPVLRLPTDKPRPAVQTFVGANHDFRVPFKLAGRLKRMAMRREATFYMVLLSAWQILLHRYSGQDDICVGSPTVGRLQPEFAEIIGDFVNPIVLRNNLAGNPRYSIYLSQVMETVLGALSNQEYPFQLLVEKLCPQRDPGTSPLFQAMFSLQKPHQLKGAAPFVLGDSHAHFHLGDLLLETYPLPVTASQVDIALTIVDTDDGLSMRLVYNTDLFEPTTIARMASHYETLLSSIVETPDQQIDQLNMLNQAEHNRLTAGNATAVDFPREAAFAQLFEHTVTLYPDAEALVFNGQEEVRLSYDQLNRYANRLAHQLRETGVNCETAVGVCMDRSPQMLIALLAVFKSGGYYVPLDPTYPADRVAHILENAHAKVLLTQTHLLETLPTRDARVICVDQADHRGHSDETNPVTTTDARNLAYTIYTSGSTGKPKGVGISHRNLINFLHAMAQQPGLSHQDRFLAVTTVSFDIAGLEFYLPLLTGACLVLANRDETADGQLLADNIRRNQITAIQGTPATYRLLLSTDWQGSPRALCGGEAFPTALAEELIARGAEPWNMYGPTETTIWSAVRAVEVAGSGSVETLGPPIANTSLYIVDRQMTSTPIGIPGELLIGGEGLARGYDRRPDLTADRFIPNPFADKAGDRLYRTGDLARFRENGDIEFLGRLDFQVKVRGHRIETGEIEKVLSEHHQVAQAVVVVRLFGEDDARLIAYHVAKGDQAERSELRTFLADKLPAYMLPAFYVALDSLPLTPNGKIDRRALPMPNESAAPTNTPPQTELEQTIAAIWVRVLKIESVGLHDNFFELGGHSLLMTQVNEELKKELGLKLGMVEMFQYPTIAAMAGFIAGKDTGQGPKTRRTAVIEGNEPIAVVGMAGRFPGADNVDSFWNNIINGVESIVTLSDEALLEAGVNRTQLQDPDYVKAGSFLTDPEYFDARLFDFSPREARLIDPQQRLFLETCWEAMEHASCDPENYDGAVGVFAGSGMNTYLFNNLYSNPDLLDREGMFQVMFSSDKDFLATRVAYKLGLNGPAVNLQTACSTSLVAAHEACKSLRSGESDMALAGGATIRFPHGVGYQFQEGLILSREGHCRTFDKAAGGTVSASGVAAVVLKRLSDARADRDLIYAVIKGSAINNDAAEKVGFTAPGVNGQAAVIRDAVTAAGIEPDSVELVEAHGTGTRIGDPIEIAGLRMNYAARGEEPHCAIGSVKSNIGHLDTAAGVAGLIKATLAVHHKQLPPTLNFDQLNPEINLEGGPFYINTQLRPWPKTAKPRRAAVSSFGIGGTNAHLILEEGPVREASPVEQGRQLLVFSAKTGAALDAMTTNLADFLETNPAHLGDVAHTLQTGRRALNHRRVLTAKSTADAVAGLRDPSRLLGRHEETRQRPVVFMFSGQGAQYVNMARDLYEDDADFRQRIDYCCDLLHPMLGEDPRKILFPADLTEEAVTRLNHTAITQPMLFTIEYALAELWNRRGVEAAAMIGHSIGEYTAACLAGVFTLEDALELVAARGRLIGDLPGGSMLAVPLPEEEVKTFLNDEISLAAVNGPAMCVVSGSKEAIETLYNRLLGRNISLSHLHTSHAFHSHMMDPIIEAFTDRVSRVVLKAPNKPYISNVTGTWITPEQAMSPKYWAQHLRGCVHFGAGLAELFKDPRRLFLEVGPGRNLTTLTNRHPDKGADRLVFNSVRHIQDQQQDTDYFLTSLGKLWLAGVTVDWRKTPSAANRVVLPAYPFQREKFWVEPGEFTSTAKQVEEARRDDVSEWFYAPSWKRVPVIAAPELPAAKRLLFTDKKGLGNQLFESFPEGDTVLVREGDAFTRLSENEYTINPTDPVQYDELLALLEGKDHAPSQIIHLWQVGGEPGTALDATRLKQARDTGLYSLMYLAQAIGNHFNDHTLDLCVVADGLAEVSGESLHSPEKAMLQGALRVIGQEYTGVTPRLIDIRLEADLQSQAKRLAADIAAGGDDTLTAWRGRRRFVQTYEALQLPPVEKTVNLQENAAYLITGGLGGIGLEIARYLAKTVSPKLVLTGRNALPEESQWDKALLEGGKTAARIRSVRALRELGAEVMTVAADVTDRESVRVTLEQARQRFGRIHGVLHAAGVPGGGVIQTRTREDAELILAPKLEGALILDELLAGDAPDFTVLFSSVNGPLGGFGQFDYAAANTFLDAFAESKQDAPGHTLAINWDSWRQVGMAADTLAKYAPAVEETVAVDHPLLDSKLVNEHVYISNFNVATHWPLNEHWILDKAILPGTTYLEMARAAYEQSFGEGPLSIRDAVFLMPLILEPGEDRQVRTQLTMDGADVHYSIKSGADKQWREHSRGTLSRIEAGHTQMDLDKIRALCNRDTVSGPLMNDAMGDFKIARQTRELDNGGSVDLAVITDHADPPTVSIELGPRWQTITQVALGQGRGLATLELDAAAHDDLIHHKLHPALLDFAVGYLRLYEDQAGYLPLSYGELRLYHPLPAFIYSHIRFADNYDPNKGNPIFDIDLLNRDGLLLAQIRGFALGKIDGAGLTKAAPKPAPAKANLPEVEELTRYWMEPAEGVDAFVRLLHTDLPRAVVSTRDFNQRLLDTAKSESHAHGAFQQDDYAAPSHPRPDLMTPYAAPRNDLERKLASIWQEVIGLTEVGAFDDFFELGGDSLLVTRVHARVQKELESKISVPELMQYPTISELAAFLTKNQKQAEPELTRVKDRAVKQKRSMSRNKKMRKQKRSTIR